MSSFKLYAAALLTLGSAAALAIAAKNSHDSHCDKASGMCRVNDVETPTDRALNAAWTINPWNVLTTFNSSPKDDEGWKPVNVDGVPSEYQVRPSNDKKEKGCTLTSVRELAPPKKILATPADGLVCG